MVRPFTPGSGASFWKLGHGRGSFECPPSPGTPPPPNLLLSHLNVPWGSAAEASGAERHRKSQVGHRGRRPGGRGPLPLAERGALSDFAPLR